MKGQQDLTNTRQRNPSVLEEDDIILLRPDMLKKKEPKEEYVPSPTTPLPKLSPSSSTPPPVSQSTPLPRSTTSLARETLLRAQAQQSVYLERLPSHIRKIQAQWKTAQENQGLRTQELLSLYQSVFVLGGLSQTCELRQLHGLAQELLQSLNSLFRVSTVNVEQAYRHACLQIKQLSHQVERVSSFPIPRLSDLKTEAYSQERASSYINQGELRPGLVVGERYEVLAEVARGGVGIVYLVRDSRDHSLQALKILSLRKSRNNKNYQRFQREVKMLEKLQHSALIRMHDTGTAQRIPYYVMNYLPGGSMHSHLESGALPPPVALSLIMQVSEALHHAHQNGVLHRDIKSTNILFDEQGNPILTDFSSALPVDKNATRLTRMGSVIGTPCYMAPEQFTGSSPLDQRSDIFSLGFLLYEMLAGYHPLAELHPTEALSKITTNRYPQLSEINPALPESILHICERAMAHERNHRYASASDLAFVCQREIQQMDAIFTLPASVKESSNNE